MILKIVLYSFTTLFILSITLVYATDIQVLDKTETNLHMSLRNMQWQQELSKTDVKQLKIGLKSLKEEIVKTAIKVVALHHVSEAIPILEKGVGVSYGNIRIVGDIIVEAFNAKNGLIDYLRTVSLNNVPVSARIPISKILASIIVIEEAKMLRSQKTKEPNIKQIELNKFQHKLLDYSNIPEDEAINAIIKNLSIAKVAGEDEYRMLDILRTYNNNYVRIVMNKLSDKQEVTKISNYGMLLLLNSLRPVVYKMDSSTKKDLTLILQSLNSEDFKPISRTVYWLTEELSK